MSSESVPKYTDLSTPDSFRFTFHCERCGSGLYSERYTFNLEGFIQPINENARAMLWVRQHDEAYARACSEARSDFNICPHCGRSVCNQCFYVVSEAVTDMCVDCYLEREKPIKWKSFLSWQQI